MFRGINPDFFIPEIFEPVFLSQKPFKVTYGGRYSGKTYASVARLIQRAITKPRLQMMVRTHYIAAKRNTFKSFMRVARDMGVQDLFHPIPSEGRIDVFNGGRIEIAGTEVNPDSLKGLEECETLLWEEADKNSMTAFRKICNGALRVEDFREVDGVLVNEGSEILVNFNTNYEDDAVYQIFVANRHPGAEVVFANYWDVWPFLTQSMKEEILHAKQTDNDRWKHEFCGGLNVRSDALVFHKKIPPTLDGRGNWHEEEIPADEIPDYARTTLGIDFGWSATDPACIVEALFWDRICYIRQEVVRFKQPVNSLYGEFCEIASFRNGYTAVADSARPDSIDLLNQSAPRKNQIIGSDKGSGSILDGIAFLKGFDIVVHPSCTTAVSELTNHKWNVDKDGYIGKGKGESQFEDKYNHILDSLRYGSELVRDYYRSVGVMGGQDQVGHRLF